MRKRGAPNHITPQRIRHIFVEWAASSGDLILRNIDQLAACMGNTPRLWAEVYDLTCNVRSVEASMQAFTKIQEHLKQQVQSRRLALAMEEQQLEEQAMEEDAGPSTRPPLQRLLRGSELPPPDEVMEEEEGVVESEGEDTDCEYGPDPFFSIDL